MSLEKYFRDEMYLTSSTPNVPLLRKIMEHITAHPEEWNQGSWAMQRQLYNAETNELTTCGTAYCVAGHAVHMAGHEILWNKSNNDANEVVVDGIRMDIPEAARKELGLPNSVAIRLFQGSNTLDDLWRFVEAITDGEVTRA